MLFFCFFHVLLFFFIGFLVWDICFTLDGRGFFYSFSYFPGLNHLFRLDGELLFCLQQQKSNQKNAAPYHSPPVKNTGVPSSLTIRSAAAELAIKNMAQTVLADNSSHIAPSSVSSKGD